MFFIFIFSITSPPTPIPGGATCHIGRETIVKTKKEKKSPLASEMLTRVRRTNYTPVTTQGLALFQPSKTYLSTACGKKKWQNVVRDSGALIGALDASSQSILRTVLLTLVF